MFKTTLIGFGIAIFALTGCADKQDSHLEQMREAVNAVELRNVEQGKDAAINCGEFKDVNGTWKGYVSLVENSGAFSFSVEGSPEYTSAKMAFCKE